MPPDRRSDRQKEAQREPEDSISYFERTMNEALENSMRNTHEQKDEE